MSGTQYNKPFLPIDEQVRRLRERGLEISDEDHAADVLRRVGYYRISGYSHLFRELPPERTHGAPAVDAGIGSVDAGTGTEIVNEDSSPVEVSADGGGRESLGGDEPDDANPVEAGTERPLEKRLSTFIPGTTFAQVEQIYTFDRALRMRVFDALEMVEIALRARVGYLVGQGHAFAHRDPHHLHSDFTGQTRPKPGMEYSSWLDSNHAEWLRGVDREEDRSQETFVQHIRETYGPPLPIWAATEIMSFGTLTLLYSGMDRAQQNRVAGALGLFGQSRQGDGSTLANWLNHLRYIRNVCAHHARLWNRNVTVQLGEISTVTELAHLDTRGRSRVYGSLTILAFLLCRLAPHSTWRVDIKDFILTETARMGQPAAAMGFPHDWENLDVWADTYAHPDPQWESQQDLLDRLPSVAAGELGRLLRPDHSHKDQASWVRYLRKNGFLLGVRQGDLYLYPTFQVDEKHGTVREDIGLINRRLLRAADSVDREPVAETDEWAAAKWWCTPLTKHDAQTPLRLSQSGPLNPDTLTNQ